MRAKELYVKWKPTALRTEVGRSNACGKSFGQQFRQLLRVAISLRSSTARRNAVADTSAIALVFLAHLCVAAIATAKIHSKFDLTRQESGKLTKSKTMMSHFNSKIAMRRNCSIKLHFKG